jgi:hypothetical protein
LKPDAQTSNFPSLAVVDQQGTTVTRETELTLVCSKSPLQISWQETVWELALLQISNNAIAAKSLFRSTGVQSTKI